MRGRPSTADDRSGCGPGDGLRESEHFIRADLERVAMYPESHIAAARHVGQLWNRCRGFPDCAGGNGLTRVTNGSAVATTFGVEGQGVSNKIRPTAWNAALFV